MVRADRGGSRAKREARRLALFAVVGGILQLIVIRWADRRFEDPFRLWLEGGLFVLYMVVIVVLLQRVIRGQRER